MDPIKKTGAGKYEYELTFDEAGEPVIKITGGPGISDHIVLRSEGMSENNKKAYEAIIKEEFAEEIAAERAASAERGRAKATGAGESEYADEGEAPASTTMSDKIGGILGRAKESAMAAGRAGTKAGAATGALGGALTGGVGGATAGAVKGALSGAASGQASGAAGSMIHDTGAPGAIRDAVGDAASAVGKGVRSAAERAVQSLSLPNDAATEASREQNMAALGRR